MQPGRATIPLTVTRDELRSINIQRAPFRAMSVFFFVQLHLFHAMQWSSTSAPVFSFVFPLLFFAFVSPTSEAELQLLAIFTLQYSAVLATVRVFGSRCRCKSREALESRVVQAQQERWRSDAFGRQLRLFGVATPSIFFFGGGWGGGGWKGTPKGEPTIHLAAPNSKRHTWQPL